MHLQCLFEFKGQHRVLFTRQPPNVQQKCQTHLQGCLHFSDLLAVKRHTSTWPGSQGICANVIFIAAAIILWDYPCQVHLELEFHICAGSRCLYEPEKFLHSARWMCCCSYSISPSSSIYQDVTKQVELRLNCFFFFLATIYFQSILNRTDALF